MRLAALDGPQLARFPMLEQLISQACGMAHGIETEAAGPAAGDEPPNAASEPRWAEDPERSAMLRCARNNTHV